jgi:16S rRNA (adenine1518-N6/adenine1519-N6)-dimethyltransferase
MKKKFSKNKSFIESAKTGAFGLEAKKALGQNFLIDNNILNTIALEAEKICATSCLEIGPGTGALTKKILEKNIPVFAIEKDSRAVEGLRETILNSNKENFFICEQDILKWNDFYNLENFHINFKKKPPTCIGNLPYYITSDILFWFLKNKKEFSAGLFMLQNEVADRICSQPGNKTYGRLSVRLQLEAKVEKILFVPRISFSPSAKRRFRCCKNYPF